MIHQLFDAAAADERRAFPHTERVRSAIRARLTRKIVLTGDTRSISTLHLWQKNFADVCAIILSAMFALICVYVCARDLLKCSICLFVSNMFRKAMRACDGRWLLIKLQWR